MSTAVIEKNPRYFKAVKGIVAGLKKGSLTVILADGRRFETVGAEPGPAGELTVLNEDLFGRVIRDGDLGFAEAYMDGWYDTPDLQALLDVIMVNNDSVGRGFPAQGLVRMFERLRHWMNRNTKSGSAKNISAHYDLGNEFYAKWLDETMSYSSALYRSDNENMEEAQINKYASICDRMNMGEDAHVLEVGCGWGGFAEYAAGVRGAKVTGLTISKEQHDFAKARMFREGLNEKVDIVMRDYRDERGTYDGIASIEMFEAVGEAYWPGYFNMIKERLTPGATASLQIITIADNLFPYYRKNVDFIQKYIFPGGMLPSPTALREQVAQAGLTYRSSIEFGESYSDTLREWREAFNDKWDEISRLGFDPRFSRMWNFYLASCASCFMAGTTDVTQIAIQRPA